MAGSHPDIESVLLDEPTIKDIVHRVGERISVDYAGKNPLIVSVLTGAFVFVADLVREIEIPCEVDFIAASSYGASTTSSGVVDIYKDLNHDIRGRHVIIVEDIFDTGLTLRKLKETLLEREPASVEIAVFAVKDVPGKRYEVDPAYVGVHVPDAFIVGYGLDFDERYRNLPYVGTLKPEVYGQ